VIGEEQDLSSLADAVQAAGLVEVLQNNGPFSVLCPMNDAFAVADQDGGLVTKLLTADWKAHLTALLRFHVYNGILLAADITEGLSISSLLVNSEDVTASIATDGGVSFSSMAFNESRVVEADFTADNGVVHKVDKVFIPAALTMSIFEIAETFDGFSSVIGQITQAGLEDTLRTGNVTIFGPTNDAFSALPPSAFGQFVTDPNAVQRLFANHIAEGLYYKERLTNGVELTMLSGEKLPISVTEGRFPTYIIGNNATIQVFDVVASNGLAHIINGVLFPPPQENPPTSAPSVAPPPPKATTPPTVSPPVPTSSSASVASTVTMWLCSSIVAASAVFI
jgi:transforming growth factor-beta-induced protein